MTSWVVKGTGGPSRILALNCEGPSVLAPNSLEVNQSWEEKPGVSCFSSLLSRDKANEHHHWNGWPACSTEQVGVQPAKELPPGKEKHSELKNRKRSLPLYLAEKIRALGQNSHPGEDAGESRHLPQVYRGRRVGVASSASTHTLSPVYTTKQNGTTLLAPPSSGNLGNCSSTWQQTCSPT